MEFCPECGSIMKKKNEEGLRILACTQCNHEEPLEDESADKYKAKKEMDKHPSEETIVIDEDEIDTKPKTNEKCPECGNNEAYHWQIQTRSADEPATRFFKCTECGNTWRDYD